MMVVENDQEMFISFISTIKEDPNYITSEITGKKITLQLIYGNHHSIEVKVIIDTSCNKVSIIARNYEVFATRYDGMDTLIRTLKMFDGLLKELYPY